jgi:hypothetical protein
MRSRFAVLVVLLFTTVAAACTSATAPTARQDCGGGMTSGSSGHC